MWKHWLVFSLSFAVLALFTTQRVQDLRYELWIAFEILLSAWYFYLFLKGYLRTHWI